MSDEERTYINSKGEYVTLFSLVRDEPEWARSRILVLTSERDRARDLAVRLEGELAETKSKLDYPGEWIAVVEVENQRLKTDLADATECALHNENAAANLTNENQRLREALKYHCDNCEALAEIKEEEPRCFECPSRDALHPAGEGEK